MTVSTNSARAEYTGNASTTAFAVVDTLGASAVIPVSDASHLQVYVDGTLKVEDTHYTVSIVTATKAATVTFITSPTDYTPASDATIVILRVVPYTQLQDYVNNDAFDAENVESALDQVTQQTQQLADDKDRTIKFDSTIHLSDFNTTAETASKITANKSNRAEKLLSFDSNGDVQTTQEIGAWKGNWVSGTTYVERDLVKDAETGAIYICTSGHRAGTFATDLSASKWETIIDAGGFNVKLTGDVTVESGETLVTPYKIDLNGNTLTNNGTIYCAEILTGTGTFTGGESSSTIQSGPINLTDAGVALTSTAVTVSGTQTLTNKTLTSPKINEDVVMSATATELNLLDGVSGLVQADFTKLAGIDATADELNVMDAGATITTPTVAGGDAFVMDDADVGMRQVDIDNVDTYLSQTSKTLENKKIPEIDSDSSITLDAETSVELNANNGIIYMKDDSATILTIQLSGGNTTITGP